MPDETETVETFTVDEVSDASEQTDEAEAEGAESATAPEATAEALTPQEQLEAFRAAGIADALLDVRTDASGGILSVSRIGVESH